MNNTLTKIKIFFAQLGGKIESITVKHPFLCCLTMGIAMNILIAMLHARSFIGGFTDIFSGFGFFIFNSLILITFYVLSLFSPRRIFIMTFVTLFWLAMGVADCVLMCMRNAPLGGIDFYILSTGFGIVFVYMKIWEIILYSALILLSVTLLVLFFIKCPKIRPDYLKALLILICCLLSLSLIGAAAIKLDKNHEENLTVERCGFPYFFLRSIFDRGIDEPEAYSAPTIQDIVERLKRNESTPPKIKPDVIFVQLESFYDVSRMTEIEFSQNPIPNYTALAEKFPGGLLEVPSIGSGTANTEFEVLSGLDLTFFGTGEYPYESILGDRCCETAAYNLKELGYTTHALHNHTATFYDRFSVYANLGFDTFTAAEYMKGIEYNAIGWEKDAILTDYIIKALDSTDTRDFVFAVSVQGHGKYPDIPMGNENGIEVFGIDEEERKNTFEFFANQLYETDAFIGELYNALTERGEDFVLVLYGDHLPALEMSADELENRNLYETDYLIISNFELAIKGENLEAYMLFPTVFEALGIDNGLVNKVHSEFKNAENYSEILEIVSYDMLYGDRLAYMENYPYTPSDIRLGIEEISISSAETDETGLYVTGENFTPFSRIFINGRKTETVFVDERTLFAEGESAEYGDEILVVQISSDFRKLSQSDIFTVSRQFLD